MDLRDWLADDLESVRTRMEGAVVSQVPEDRWREQAWSGKPASWFVRWELIGRAQGHVGEMVSVRDRLGYCPF